MKSVFIQLWMFSRKYLQSAYLPLAMSQMMAMKLLWFVPKMTSSTRNNEAFTHCGISLISPPHCIRNIVLNCNSSGSLKKQRFWICFYFVRKATPSLLQFSGEWHIYIIYHYVIKHYHKKDIIKKDNILSLFSVWLQYIYIMSLV